MGLLAQAAGGELESLFLVRRHAPHPRRHPPRRTTDRGRWLGIGLGGQLARSLWPGEAYTLRVYEIDSTGGVETSGKNQHQAEGKTNIIRSSSSPKSKMRLGISKGTSAWNGPQSSAAPPRALRATIRRRRAHPLPTLCVLHAAQTALLIRAAENADPLGECCRACDEFGHSQFLQRVQLARNVKKKGVGASVNGPAL